MNHTGNVKDKMEEAKNTLFLADRYMEELGKEFENLRKITLSDKKVMDYQDSSIHKVRGRSGENISYGNTQNQNECQGDSYQ